MLSGHRLPRFCRSCQWFAFFRPGPGHKEEAVLVRIFQSDETPAPTLIDWRLNIGSLLRKLIVKAIDILNADEEGNTASAPQHRFEVLGQRDFQCAAAKSR